MLKRGVVFWTVSIFKSPVGLNLPVTISCKKGLFFLFVKCFSKLHSSYFLPELLTQASWFSRPPPPSWRCQDTWKDKTIKFPRSSSSHTSSSERVPQAHQAVVLWKWFSPSSVSCQPTEVRRTSKPPSGPNRPCPRSPNPTHSCGTACCKISRWCQIRFYELLPGHPAALEVHAGVHARRAGGLRERGGVGHPPVCLPRNNIRVSCHLWGKLKLWDSLRASCNENTKFVILTKSLIIISPERKPLAWSS